MSVFKKATKSQSKLRLCLFGVSGSGKTYTSLLLAKALAAGGPVALIDTERGSASKYAGDVADFDSLELTSYEPAKYIKAIRAAADERYPVLVIDSLSHAWAGRGGILDQKDAKGGRFEGWKDLTPQQNDLLEAILGYPGHVILTMRAKTEYVVDQVEKNGRTVASPRKVGLAPVQRQDMEYEFDVVLRLDADNIAHVEKTRCAALTGLSIRKPGAELAEMLRAWLSDGAPAVAPPSPPASEPRPQQTAAPTGEPSEEDLVLIEQIAKCSTVDELQAFAASLAPERKTPAVRAVYTTRAKLLRGQQGAA